MYYTPFWECLEGENEGKNLQDGPYILVRQQLDTNYFMKIGQPNLSVFPLLSIFTSDALAGSPDSISMLPDLVNL